MKLTIIGLIFLAATSKGASLFSLESPSIPADPAVQCTNFSGHWHGTCTASASSSPWEMDVDIDQQDCDSIGLGQQEPYSRIPIGGSSKLERIYPPDVTGKIVTYRIEVNAEWLDLARSRLMFHDVHDYSGSAQVSDIELSLQSNTLHIEGTATTGEHVDCTLSRK